MDPPPPARATLRLEGVAFRYGSRGADAFVLRDVNLRVHAGETVVLMGHNGSGKTTLLRIAAGLARPDAGSVVAARNGHDEPVLGPSPAIGYIPQQLGLVRNRTVLQNVLLGCLGRAPALATMLGRFSPGEIEAARGWIGRVGLASKEGQRVHELSGGERQRVAVARALMQRSHILLADEFLSNLDPVRAREVLRLATDPLHEGHVSTIIALHNLELARRCADRIVFLQRGRIAADLPAAEVTDEVAAWHLAA